MAQPTAEREPEPVQLQEGDWLALGFFLLIAVYPGASYLPSLWPGSLSRKHDHLRASLQTLAPCEIPSSGLPHEGHHTSSSIQSLEMAGWGLSGDQHGPSFRAQPLGEQAVPLATLLLPLALTSGSGGASVAPSSPFSCLTPP